MNFQTKTLETFNPFESLKNEQKNTDKILDFRVIDFKLLCSNTQKTKTYERKDFNLFYDDNFFVKNYNTMVHKFIIEIYPKTHQEAFIIELKPNANLTYLKAHVIFMDDFQYYSSLKFDILQNIYKTMIKQKFLILRLNKKLFKKIDDVILSLQKKQRIKTIELVIAKGVNKIEHKKRDEIIYHNNIEGRYTGKNINYSKTNYRKAVKKNELLFEYVYKILGKEGRNLRGEMLHINPINFIENPLIIKDESIYSQQLEDRIQYFSANYGFLNKDHIGFSVINDFNLLQKDSLKDPNDTLESVNIQVSNIKVNGNIGLTRVYAKNINIRGFTDEKSEIFAENVFIKTHKGNLQADTAYIKNLENGNVIAKNVFVENCRGAKIQAENIYICNLLNDNILYPRKNLIIANNLKFKNTINISPLLPIEEGTDKEYNDIKNLCLKVKNKLYKTINKMHNYYDYLIKNQIKIIQFQKIKNPNIIDKYNQLNASYKRFIKLKHQVNTKLILLDEIIYNVKIYIKTKKIGKDNFLKFYPKTNTKIGLSYNLTSKDYEKVFYLHKEQQANYIKCSHDYNEKEIKAIKALFKKLQKDNF
ncbi:FapA family protein [Campylobacter sp. VicNov18]|uniref:flagellar assembly protein A n=1 Tax=Campylobacter bilis TaxID=2691918 RepID=UPI00130DC85C|nr:flagellar assembly protein A [Campylobacter bilis]MPV63079.1 DUF342 domain-containing protein [Campylobacter hepaticus]MBM0636578.1 DUF342 domain-containing protein [Campylobacter bilis]MCC8277286.1 FapA family protein [Campylobacter bilis]MCC8299029.1 FapA family protein [Campylobacter bilis]MCC8300195.1 FapA family protein [Campylobacter bilis]